MGLYEAEAAWRERPPCAGGKINRPSVPRGIEGRLLNTRRTLSRTGHFSDFQSLVKKFPLFLLAWAAL